MGFISRFKELNEKSKECKNFGSRVAAIVLLGVLCLFIYQVFWFNGKSPSKAISSIFSSDYTIKVSGTPGLDFSGGYIVVTASGNSTSKSVEDTVPKSYHVSGSIVSVSFQKQSENGILKVQIMKNGKVVSSSDTSATYGVVTIATD